MKYDVVIIGAGPAGLFAATQLGAQNKQVLLIEKNKSAGKKLLISGAGQCNITHDGDMRDYSTCYGDGYKYIKPALDHFSNQDTIDFFEARGLKMVSLENGKIFPKTRSAHDVLEVLLKECAKYKVDINYNEKVNDITPTQDKGYVVKTNVGDYTCKFIVVATGGRSYPKTGSTGDGYKLGAQLGHRIIEPRPALTPVEITEFPFVHLAGMSFEDLPITIWREGKKIKDCQGDLLFTHKGLSGPGILNHTRWIKEKDVLTINFVKTMYPTDFQKAILNDINSNGGEMIKTIVRKYNLPKRLRDSLFHYANIDEEIKCGQISKEMRTQLVQALTQLPMEVSKLGGFHVAMVTAGGIHMKEINPTTMESRRKQNIYFIGEVLDIDGDTGGYNIQAALSSAVLCANGIKRKGIQ